MKKILLVLTLLLSLFMFGSCGKKTGKKNISQSSYILGVRSFNNEFYEKNTIKGMYLQYYWWEELEIWAERDEKLYISEGPEYTVTVINNQEEFESVFSKSYYNSLKIDFEKESYILYTYLTNRFLLEFGKSNYEVVDGTLKINSEIFYTFSALDYDDAGAAYIGFKINKCEFNEVNISVLETYIADKNK